MINKEHLTPERIKALKTGRLSKDETLFALEHIGECEQCADALAESYRETELLELSPDFKAEVLLKTASVRKNAAAEKIKNRKRELCFYSFKVSIAACIALLLLFSGTLNYGMNISKMINPDLSGMNVITEDLRGFSDKLINLEVIKN